ncbi:flavin monoamine oxidase family protein [Granulicella paludicola]|uniref:flavin monoamine oxidase family protein n=1 Tax=Granulicella paludicola TaxID=474951 RepID=UPI00295BF7B7|nr:NAD(P)/FAD-dependent oxidoreductase [Granulicella paludicola]
MSDAFDVLVVGAGMAGLVAARELGRRGLRVCVVEARARVGGRVWSQAVEGGVVELGAEFVHGRAAELWALIEEAGLTTVEREGEMLQELPGGGLGVEEEDEERFGPLETLKEYVGEDVSFAEWVKGAGLAAEDVQAVSGFVEGFNAADAAKIGVKGLGAQQVAEDASEGMRAWHVVGGYQQLAEYLAGELKRLGVEVRLGWVVSAVRWSEGEVVVEGRGQTQLQTQISFGNDKSKSSGNDRLENVQVKKCVVTLPLSLVQAVNREGGLRMVPEPLAVEPARRMEMGEAARFTMVFREAWWLGSGVADRELLRKMNFLMTPVGMPPVWWVGDPTGAPTLTGWVGGPRTAELAGKTAAELGEAAVGTLAKVFGVSESVVRATLVGTYTHDWSADEFARGAYSYVPVGGLDASREMARPEAGTMFFAGEHTDVTANWGTVHAAVRSGLRVAEQVIQNSAADGKRMGGR